ncbi:gentisate 1,2-dioxygenase [Sphingobium sp. SCG-1]|nr:gentisate 1,2-dioxygenase [Sphingobium sp. SCG-1]
MAMDAFRTDLAANHLAPLWEIMRKLAALEPAKGGAPMHWSWNDLRNRVMRAGELVTAEEAERRVLVLENAQFPGEGKVTSSLYGGIQLLLPGEVAPSHRHTASALRLVMEGGGGYTSVDGEQVIMSPGDFIVTPSGTFHDHGNETDHPIIWLDGLDVFVVNLLNAPFADTYPEARQPITKTSGESAALFSSGLVPHGFTRAQGGSPIFCWPYSRTRPALDLLNKAGRVDPALGVKMDFIDPTSAKSPIPTMTASMRLLPAGFSSDPYRCVSGTVMSVVEGHGRVCIGSQSWDIGLNDVFVVPSWTWSQFEVDEELILFGFSDEVLQRQLGFWREERMDKERA